MDAATDQFRWHQLSWLIGLVSMTGRILPEKRPQSLLVLGEPGTGKTANLERFMSEDSDPFNAHMAFVTNATMMGLHNILKNRVHKGVTHMIVPEFQTLIMKRSGVWETMLGTLLPAMEEGIRDVYMGDQRVTFGGARLGVIAAMPTDAYYRNAEMLRGTGFLSRVMVIQYERLPEYVLAARHRYNHGDRDELSKIEVPLQGMIEVSVSKQVKSLVTEYAATVDATNIHRETARFLALTKAVAYARKEKAATLADVDLLVSAEHFWKSGDA